MYLKLIFLTTPFKWAFVEIHWHLRNTARGIVNQENEPMNRAVHTSSSIPLTNEILRFRKIAQPITSKICTILSQFVSSWVIVRYDGIILRLASAWAKIGSRHGAWVLASSWTRHWDQALAIASSCGPLPTVSSYRQLSNPSWDGALFSPSLQDTRKMNRQWREETSPPWWQDEAFLGTVTSSGQTRSLGSWEQITTRHQSTRLISLPTWWRGQD